MRFATPAELERETARHPRRGDAVFVDGDHSLRRSEAEVADVVAGWLGDLR